jgi:hypothetical protein
LGFGGAIVNLGALSALSCAFVGNSAVGGSGAIGMYPINAAAGGTAYGGAIYSLGTLTIEQSLFLSNSVTGGNGGYGFSGTEFTLNGASGGPGGSANGGAFSLRGASALVNCTLAWNEARGGYGGSGGAGGMIVTHGGVVYGAGGSGANGGNGMGGALEQSTGSLWTTNCTIAFNRSTYGAGGFAGSGVPPGQPGANGTASGVFYTAGTLAVNNVLSDNSPANAAGTIVDGGYNLSSDGSCGFNAPGSRNYTAALLGPVSNNGGPTATVALLPGSPAIDAADTSRAPTVDQRGFPRPAGQAADIGAYEFASVGLSISLVDAYNFDVVIVGVPGQTCELWSCRNLLSWTPIATNQFGSDGRLVLHDTLKGAQRYFRAFLP